MKRYFLNIDYFILLILFIFLIINLIMLWSISNKNVNFIYKTLINILISFLVMIISSNIPLYIYKKFSLLFYIISIFLLILLKNINLTNKNVNRWIKIKNFYFQPSELIKVSLPLFMSYLIEKYGYPNSLLFLLEYLFLISLPSFLIALQPNLGTSIIIFISGLLVLFISGIDYKTIFSIFVFTLIIFYINWIFFMKSYQKKRIFNLFNQNLDLFNNSYHINQSKIAIGSGGLFGKGLFKGTQSKFKFVPESHTDFIFSIIAEEFGLLGILFVFFLYIIFIIRILILSIFNKNIFNKMLIYSFMSTIFINVIVNIGMTIGIFPIVGIPLPFISYGGSSLIIIFLKIGIINSINISNKYNNDNKIFWS